jgi:anaerobic dimethyl sulfoxide reductase subunit C (anchor subunit)
MNTREWALITFTILTEMSVGAFLVLGVVHYFVSRKAGEKEADKMSDRVLVAIIVTLGLGMLASLFHLGTPLNAPKAVTNIGTSWLSREILLGVIFAVLGLVFVAMQWFKIGTAGVRNVIAWIAALVGIGLIYSQAQAYMLAAQPSWNTFATPVTFFATTLLLGVLAIGAALVANYAFLQRKSTEGTDTQYEMLRGAIRWIAIASIVLLGIEFVVTPIYLAYLSTSSATALMSLDLMAGKYSLTFILRLVLGFLGAGVLAVFLYQNAASSGKKTVLGYLAYGAFALVLIAEVLGRFIFYATHYRIGI